jgi:Domain of unknown function (DUF4351)
MSQFPHDDFAKDFLNSLLSPFGSIQSSYKISGEVRYVDIYFQPQIDVREASALPNLDTESLGFLAKFAKEPIVIEPFRNSVKVPQIRACMSKLFDLHLTLVKEERKQKQREPEDDKLPNLWILTPTLSDRLLESVGARLDLEFWGEGVYVLASGLKTGIVVIHQLPQTPENLWFRLLGKGRVQERAIAEVAQLPMNHPYRDNVLDLLGNLRVTLEAKVNIEPEERDLIMQLSPLYLEKIQAAERVGGQKEAQTLILRLLNRRVGVLPLELELQVKALPLDRLEELHDAAIDFTQLADLEAWLSQN